MEGIDTIPNTDPDNALILGTALHTGIEEGVEQALEFYQHSFPVLTDDHINEMIKLEAMIPKAKALLPPGGAFELPIGNADFIGFMDYLVPIGKGLKLDGLITGEDLEEFEAFDLYDFKYSNNAKTYAVSGQLHEYKYWYELTHPGHRIRNMYFLIVPKVKIKQKKTETLLQFRDRLQDALKEAEPTLVPIQFDPMKVVGFMTNVKHMVEAAEFPKNPNHFCGWCEYEEYCMKGWDYMLLPKNERRDLNATKKKVVWLYGAPFSGKTFFANQFPDPLMLNTDGNIKFVDAPYISIRDVVTVEGRLTKRKLAYEVFMEAVAELEKQQNDFKTIVVDLLEDVYESCRVYICDRQGWKHESDDSFRAWDMVTSEYKRMQKYLFYLFYSLKMLINQGFSNPSEQNRCAERMCYIVTDKELSQRAKDYFAQIRKTDRLIKRLTDTVFTLRSSLTSQSYELNPDKVQTSGPKNTLEETVAKIVDLEADINRRIDELVDMKQEAFTMINRIPDLDQQNILIGRYIQLKKWEDIALELNFSIQWVYELHGKGLLAFSQANSEFFRNREKQSATA